MQRVSKSCRRNVERMKLKITSTLVWLYEIHLSVWFHSILYYSTSNGTSIGIYILGFCYFAYVASSIFVLSDTCIRIYGCVASIRSRTFMVYWYNVHGHTHTRAPPTLDARVHSTCSQHKQRFKLHPSSVFLLAHYTPTLASLCVRIVHALTKSVNALPCTELPIPGRSLCFSACQFSIGSTHIRFTREQKEFVHTHSCVDEKIRGHFRNYDTLKKQKKKIRTHTRTHKVEMNARNDVTGEVATLNRWHEGDSIFIFVQSISELMGT